MSAKIISMDDYRKVKHPPVNDEYHILDGHLAGDGSYSDDAAQIWEYLGRNYKLRPEYLTLLPRRVKREEYCDE